MQIEQIKTAIGTKAGINLPQLMLVRQKDQTTGENQPWLSHWDNDKRVRITLHDDVAAKISKEPTFNGLAYKMEVIPQEGERMEYTRFVIIVPTSVEVIL